jgi:hypothetical protein
MAFRQRKLLAAQTRNETAAANLAARLEPVEHAQQVAPRRQPLRFAREQVPADDAVALEQRARDLLERLRVGGGRARVPALFFRAEG